VCTRPDAKATLDSLPGLNGADVDDDATECDTPLPGDGTMLEHLLVDDGDVDNGEHDEQAGNDGEEEEAVTPESGEDGKAGWS
jgi:hypothetical protein